jgi:tetratricopeptide (TPR) repeat protein
VTVIDGRGDLISAGAPYAILASAIRRLCGLTGSEPPAEQQQRLRDRVSIHVPAPEAERVAAFLAELCSIPCAVPGTECESLRAARQNPKLMRSGLADAFLDWLRAECAAAPVLLILDDLQWSDAISIALVGDAVKALRDAPLFVLAFARPEVHAVFPKLWSGCGLAEYALKPLSKRACERLVQQVLGHAHLTPSEIAQAVEQAAGNALFLEEIIRALSEGKPASASATVTAMLQARIGRMEHGPRRVARAAAVFGQTFWRGGVAAILGLSATSMELDEWFTALVAAEMIQPHPSSQVNNDLEYGFRHAFMRDAAYSLLTEGDLLTGHRLAAEYLAACEERDSAAAQSSEAKPYREALAYHYQQAQMFDEACATLMRAGDSMLRLGALAEARARYGAALAMTDKLQDSQHNRRSQIDILLRMVQTGMLAEKDEELFPRLERARALLKGLGDPNELSAEDRLRMARLNSLYGHIHYYRGQTPEAIGYYQKVLPIAQEAGDPELLAVPAYMIGVTFAVRGHTRRAEPLLAQAIEPLSRYGNPVDWLRAVLYYGHALMAMGRYDAGRVQLDRGHARALELNNPELVAMSYAVRCSFFRTCGDWPETIACADKTVELAEQLKNPFFASVACAYKGWAQSYLGQDEAATANRARALELAATLKGPTMLSSWFAAADCEIALNAGRYQQAIERAQALLPRLKAAGEFLAEIVTERALVMARAIQDQGELDEPMDTSRRVLTDSGNLLEAARTHLWWGRAGLLRGAAAVARHHFALAATQFADAGCAYPQAEAQRLLDRLAPA